MRFTRLRLNGFKSFVDPTDLVIAEGLTGIVGPNGCGKSNLLEALRWVMGENRASAMRGGGMEDVIFAGAATRPARHFAEVQLTIDNSERLAPSMFNDADALEITRRITRDAGSAYRVQGKEVRARDVQMLFADASTGSHSPALVRQGQIAELISARPVARRRILEEAAGIAGLYQRRHEAELKLRAAEQNLTRVDDVIEQLAAQLAQLARQARTAARYRDIGAALRRAEGLLLWRRWDEASRHSRATAAMRSDSARAAALAEAAAAAGATTRAAAESVLPPLREEEAIAGAVLNRLRIAEATLAEEARQAAARIAELDRQIAQMDRDALRAAQLNRDADDVLARLSREAAEIERAAHGHDDRLDAAAGAARNAAERLAEVEAGQIEAAEDAARVLARHQAATRLIEDCRRTLVRAESEAARAKSAGRDAAGALTRAEAERTGGAAELARAQATATRAESVLTEAETARAETQSRESDARAARSAAEGEAAALRAEIAALGRLIDRDTQTGGQLLDLMAVQPGLEKALGAALADDLRAPHDPAPGKTGWTPFAPYADPPALPGGAQPLSEQVQGPPALARRLGQVGVVPADQGAALQAALRPGQRLVSRDGDLWRWDGFRVSAADAPSAAALRLQQLNRLVELKRDLEEVQARAQGATQAHDHLTRRLADLTAADAQARAARRDADRLLTEAHRSLSRAEADQSLAAGRLEAAVLARDRHEAEAAAARDALAEAEAALDALPDPGAARAAADLARRAVETAREAMLVRRNAHDDLRRQGEGRARRSEAIAREMAGWSERQATAAAHAADLTSRQDSAAAELGRARGAPAEIAARQAILADQITQAQTRETAARDALAAAEAALRSARAAERDAEAEAGHTREARARAEAVDEAARGAVAEAADRIAETLDLSPADLAAELAADPETAPSAAALESETALLRRQRDALGAVNLRAEEDAAAIQTEHDALIREKADLDEAIRALRGGIGSLNREGRERLLTAFEQVNGNFTLLFTHLFGGGEARLQLIESDDPLEAGLEIMCQPPGKKLTTLSLLSGGEQTLTALALIFAVFLANPAPICVLDEVDAPLDDANVTRFCDLMDEMTRRTETRFMVITHHAVTMSRMDRLFGVTMGEQGVSQLVSVDLRRAAALVA